FLDRAGRGIEPTQHLLAEIRVPNHAVPIDDDVVRLAGALRQRVFGDDGARAAAADARQGLQLVLPARPLAEIDAGEELGLFAEALGIGRAAALDADLRLQPKADRGVAL